MMETYHLIGIHNMKKQILLLLSIMAATLFVSCAATHSCSKEILRLPGFFLGLWHGWIAPITFFISLFFHSIEIYAYPNNGGWYNFGFMLGVGGFAITTSRCSRS